MGICCVAQETQTGTLYQSRGLGGAGDGREVQKGGNICIVDSYLGLTENNKIL